MSEELFDAAVGIVRAGKYGFLTTLADGHPHTRLVQTMSVDADATVWIGTSPKSRKALDIALHPEVTYAVEDRVGLSYACLYAAAEIIDDPAELNAKWMREFEMFFPDGPTGGDFILLRLRPTAVEVLDFTREIHPAPFGLVPARAERTA
ncbi:pyridoxamine 5'-phosphate oxidase family protein [Nocardia uniformis]|uniref:Pyridoxamine 5'-phosphate oxidase family protein n=1 Tax=Nocardia uniformis TaxID=53432 RepID=A0A849CDM8_9NOCA|nr:pyridoxamine 5'-phosphate oxidase family protein [Nocardia uniformis]NNH74277.1 pyridoxamine 5'-phosphate oxidase family protein [Nocardia uniformis]